MEKTNLNLGHRERLREEFVKAGDKAMPDYKMLEMLLFYGIPRKDTKKLAKELIEKFGSLAGVLNAEIDELKAVGGMTQNAACLIKLVLPIAKRYLESKNNDECTLHSFEEIGKFVASQFFVEKGEKAILVCMNRMAGLDFQ